MKFSLENNSYFLRKNWILLVLVFSATLITILFNYYTIRITNGTRAYISGESKYSKGQKDAVRDLIKFIDDGKPENWNNYKKNIAIPIGDRRFREKIIKNHDETELHKALLEGKNHPDNFDDLIWIYNNFRTVIYMQDAIEIWHTADTMIKKLDQIATDYHAASLILDRESLKKEYPDIKNRIISRDVELSMLEYRFSDKLEEIARVYSSVLNKVNVFFVLLIVGGGGFSLVRLINKINKSEILLRSNNMALEEANMELDKFVYSVSHDLRAPLTSIKGLIDLLSDENELKNFPDYIAMINKSLDRQDIFIKNILAYSKNKRLQVQLVSINIEEFVKDVFNDLEFNDKAKNINFVTDYKVKYIIADQSKLRIILSNLISNSIDYMDENKNSFIKVSSEIKGEKYIITVEDNGLGIKEEMQKRIFEMFFSGIQSDKGSGIGLYIVKEAVEKMKGEILVTSNYKEGTSMKVILPKN